VLASGRACLHFLAIDQTQIELAATKTSASPTAAFAVFGASALLILPLCSYHPIHIVSLCADYYCKDITLPGRISHEPDRFYDRRDPLCHPSNFALALKETKP
jgi:hypothetical protein